MQMKILKVLLFVILVLPLKLQAEQHSQSQDLQSEGPILSHQFKITLQPANNALSVIDTITLPDNGQSAFTFRLNSLFHLRYKKRPLHPVRTVDGVSSYHIAADASRKLVLSYKGALESTPDCDWLQQTCVLLDKSGVFLDGNSHWYPDIAGARHRFSMDIKLPEQWVSLSQGKQVAGGWQEKKPQHSIYLLAGAFKVYESQPDPMLPKAMVYLQQDDPKLAREYLQATHHYLAQYSQLLGNYPYAKFATVESFWETGWGMPSFTLLGSRVMRLPFILHSSFPHEILHNWWGNGVYVDSRDGNWSEGLTAYLADHYNKTSKAERVVYRRDALQKYQAYASGGEDFPLRDFRSRHNRLTQVVGYNKALMLFHMLRKKLGNKQFFTGLKSFYRQYRFRFASFRQLERTFAQNGKHELREFFRQWRDQSGAPNLKVVAYESMPQSGDDELIIKITLQQIQTEATGQHFILDIPIKVQDVNGHFNHQTLHMSQAKQQYTLRLKESARRLLIDPYFDVLRMPDKHEVPPALNVLFSQQRKVFVLADNLSIEQETAWQEFFDGFAGDQSNVLQQDDTTIRTAEVLVILGGDNVMLKQLLLQYPQDVKLDGNQYILERSSTYDRDQHALALTLYCGNQRVPCLGEGGFSGSSKGSQQLIMLFAKKPDAVRMLARKLPHYGRYSYILLDNMTGRNVAKGQWRMTDSPMTLELGVSN